jgi:membrane protein implicated in regulation of membrane protease activity
LPELWFWFWAILAVILIVLEIFTAGFFMLPFGIGAGVAAVLAFFDVGGEYAVAWQWGAFIVVSGVSLVILRRFADRITHEPPERVAADRLLGKHGVMIQPQNPDTSVGMAMIGTEEWRAETEDRKPLSPGTKVIVDKVEGTRVIVRPVEDTGTE